MRIRVLLAVALLFCLSLFLWAGEKTAIVVSVRNQFDKPVTNASVILDFLGTHKIMKLGMKNSFHWEVHTNQLGVAHFPGIPEGKIQLQVIAKQYETFGDKFDVDGPEKTFDVKLAPPQKQYSVHPPLKPADEPKK